MFFFGVFITNFIGNTYWYSNFVVLSSLIIIYKSHCVFKTGWGSYQIISGLLRFQEQNLVVGVDETLDATLAVNHATRTGEEKKLDRVILG